MNVRIRPERGAGGRGPRSPSPPPPAPRAPVRATKAPHHAPRNTNSCAAKRDLADTAETETVT
eukprot:6173665-Prymnesium_polylepis.1